MKLARVGIVLGLMMCVRTVRRLMGAGVPMVTGLWGGKCERTSSWAAAMRAVTACSA
jgi:hypothetical protein